MLVRTAKKIANGEKITKVVTWDSIGQTYKGNKKGRNVAQILRSSMVLVKDAYYEDGDTDEERYTLSEVLDTDAVLEIWTVSGKVWEAKVQTVEDLV